MSMAWQLQLCLDIGRRRSQIEWFWNANMKKTESPWSLNSLHRWLLSGCFCLSTLLLLPTGQVAFSQRPLDATVDNLEVRANTGDIRAQYELGSRYLSGTGAAKDFEKAYYWLMLATKGGYAQAKREMFQARMALTDAQIAAVESRAGGIDETMLPDASTSGGIFDNLSNVGQQQVGPPTISDELSRRFAALGRLPELGTPSPLQMMALADLDSFGEVYDQWQRSHTSMAPQWLQTARTFHRYEKTFSSGEDGAFIARCLLARAQCYLNASIDLMRANQRPQAIAEYRTGIQLLDKVLRMTYADPESRALPAYSTIWTRDQTGARVIHPLAGYEYFATQMAAGGTFGGATSRDGTHHFPIADFQTRLTNSSLPWRIHKGQQVFWPAQETTDAAARRFLSQYCPWGVQLFLTLDQAGLTKGLDFQILRPFTFDRSPMVSESVITDRQLPMHISDEFKMMTWAETVPSLDPADTVANKKAGYLTPAKRQLVVWETVQPQPDCLIRFVSPRMLDPTPGEQLEAALKIKKLIGNPLDVLEKAWGDAVSDKITSLLDDVGKYYGKNSGAYHLSWLFVTGSENGLITTDHLVGGKMPSGWEPTIGSFAKKLFAKLDDYLMEGFFEGINPRNYSLGTGYNGEPIPPIFIRGDVLGFQHVPKQEYCRSIQSTRMYVLFPQAIAKDTASAGYEAYDIEKNPACWDMTRGTEYLAEQMRFLPPSRDESFAPRQPGQRESVRLWAWKELNAPNYGFRTYITDFSPAQQVLEVYLNRLEFQKWRESLQPGQNLWCELRAENNPSIPVINEVLFKDHFKLRIFNMHNHSGKNAYIERNAQYQSSNQHLRTKNANSNPLAFHYFGVNDLRRNKVANLALEPTNRLQTRYRLKIKAGPGPDAKSLADYRIAFATGRGNANQRVRITGILKSYVDAGLVHLTYAAKPQPDMAVTPTLPPIQPPVDQPVTPTPTTRTARGVIRGGLDATMVKKVTDHWGGMPDGGWNSKFSGPTVSLNLETGEVSPKKIIFVAEFKFQNITEVTKITHTLIGPAKKGGAGYFGGESWSGKRKWVVEKVDNPGSRTFRDQGEGEWTAYPDKEADDGTWLLSVHNAFPGIFGDIPFRLGGEPIDSGNMPSHPAPSATGQTPRPLSPLIGTYQWKDPNANESVVEITISKEGAVLNVRNYGGVPGSNGRVVLKASPQHTYLGRFPEQQDIISGQGEGTVTGRISGLNGGQPFSTGYWQCNVKGKDWPDHYGKIQLFWAGPDGNYHTYDLDADLSGF